MKIPYGISLMALFIPFASGASALPLSLSGDSNTIPPINGTTSQQNIQRQWQAERRRGHEEGHRANQESWNDNRRQANGDHGHNEQHHSAPLVHPNIKVPPYHQDQGFRDRYEEMMNSPQKLRDGAGSEE